MAKKNDGTIRGSAALYDVEVPTINERIAKMYYDNELQEMATIRNFRIVQSEGSRSVSREVILYNFQMIITIGFNVNNERAVQFRKWAGGIVKKFYQKGGRAPERNRRP